MTSQPGARSRDRARTHHIQHTAAHHIQHVRVLHAHAHAHSAGRRTTGGRPPSCHLPTRREPRTQGHPTGRGPTHLGSQHAPCAPHTQTLEAPGRSATQSANAHIADTRASHTSAPRHARPATYSARAGRIHKGPCPPSSRVLRPRMRSCCTLERQLREHDVAASRRPTSARARRRAARSGAHGQQPASQERCQLQPHMSTGRWRTHARGQARRVRPSTRRSARAATSRAAPSRP